MPNAMVLSLIMQYAGAYHVPPNLAIAIIQYESSFNTDARGEAGEIGLFQLLPSTFPTYTETQLFKPEINIKLGMKYLADMKESCVYRKDYEYSICFNLGPEKAKKVKHPLQFPYYRKIMENMNHGNSN
jgi:membrane-bound lytic murein transglycosylase MltF